MLLYQRVVGTGRALAVGAPRSCTAGTVPSRDRAFLPSSSWPHLPPLWLLPARGLAAAHRRPGGQRLTRGANAGVFDQLLPRGVDRLGEQGWRDRSRAGVDTHEHAPGVWGDSERWSAVHKLRLPGCRGVNAVPSTQHIACDPACCQQSVSTPASLGNTQPRVACTITSADLRVGDALGRRVREGSVWWPHSLHTAEVTGSIPVTPTSTNRFLTYLRGPSCQQIASKPPWVRVVTLWALSGSRA
jgi:hypothetical protein